MQLFAQDGHEPVICQSFAKNFGMYGERVGSMTVLTDSVDTSAKVGISVNSWSFELLIFFFFFFFFFFFLG